MSENIPETGVKDQSEASPAPEARPQTAIPPAESNSAQPKEETPGHVPYSRFKEINEKKKSLETELTELRGKLAGRDRENSEKAEAESLTKAVNKLVQNGMNPQAAQVLTEVFKDLAGKEGKKYSSELETIKKHLDAELEVKNAEKQLAERQAEFRKAHPDHAEYESAMTKRWEALDDDSQRALLSSPKAYELLYSSAKAGRLEELMQKGREEGRQEAYDSKNLKSAISSTPGATAQPKKKYTAEDIPKLSMKEYKENRAQILEDLYGHK